MMLFSNAFCALAGRLLHGSTLIGAALVLAACGGNAPEDGRAAEALTQTTTAAEPRDACALLPGSEVAAVIGRAARDSLAMQMEDEAGTVALSQCNYATERSPAEFSLMLRRETGGASAADASASVRQTLSESGVTVQDVSGLGEAAFWGGNQLHVFTGQGWYLIVSTSGDAGLPQAQALAERALARL